jgi:hypothetical protein
MKYDDVLQDIEKLVGKKLRSINKGADIIIEQVDVENNRILLTTVSGKQKPRPLSEIRELWELLNKKPIVHVDSALGGSGSSRNQPETILANLPYIEWLRHDDKKHISYVREATHPLGTLKQMDAMSVQKIKQELLEGKVSDQIANIMVVADDIRQATRLLEGVTGLAAKPIGGGVYEQPSKSGSMLVVPVSLVPSQVEPGTYAVLQGDPPGEKGTELEIAGRRFVMVQQGGASIMLALDED